MEVVAQVLSDDQDINKIRHKLQRLIKRYGEDVWVYVAATKIAQSAAGIPWSVVRQNNQGDEEFVTSGRFYDLMKRPNPHQSIFDFIESHQNSMELAGESFIELDRGMSGVATPRAIYPLPLFDEDTMRVIRDPRLAGTPDGPIRGYIYTIQGKRVAFTPEEIIHVKYYNPFDPFRGMPPLRAAALSVDSNVKAHEYNNLFFSNSAEPRGHFESEDNVNPSQWKRFVRLIEARHKGHKKSHRPLMLRGVKWKRTQQNPKDVELLNGMKLNAIEILAVFGVTPVIAGILEKNPQANAEVQERTFWKGAVVPKTKKLEDKLNAELAPLFNGGNLRIRRDFSAVPALQEDFTAKLDDAIKLQTLGYPANEINKRLELGMPDLAWGDTVLVNPLLAPVESVVAGGGDGDRAIIARLMNFLGQVEREEIHVTSKEIPALPARSIKDAKREALERFEVRQGRAEEEATVKFADFFHAQRVRILNNLNAEGALRIGEKVRAPVSFDMSIIFDAIDELDQFQDLSQEVLRETLLDSMLSFISDHNLDETAIDMTSDSILSYLQDESFRHAQNVTDTTRKRLTKELKAAIESGESIDQIAARIEEVFTKRASSAQTIARTETVSSTNFGSQEAAIQSGVSSRSWISSRDLKVRDPHSDIDFKTTENPIPISTPYTLSEGSQLNHPGDSSLGASADQVVNCRCTQLFNF